MGPPTHYDTLGIAADATTADVRRAYRTLARTTHPDLGGDASAFAQVQEAHDVLRAPGSRSAYDAELRATALKAARAADAERAERARRAARSVEHAQAALRRAHARRAVEGAAAYYPHGVPGLDGLPATYGQRINSELSALGALHPELRDPSSTRQLRSALAQNRARARASTETGRRSVPGRELALLLASLAVGAAVRASGAVGELAATLGAVAGHPPSIGVTLGSTTALAAVLLILTVVRAAAGPWTTAELRVAWSASAIAVAAWELLARVPVGHEVLLGALALYATYVTVLRLLPRPMTHRAWSSARAWLRELTEEAFLRPWHVRRWVRAAR